MFDFIYPLLSAAAFASSSVIIKHLSSYAPASQLNFMRTLIGAVCFIIQFIIIDQISTLLVLGGYIIAFLVISVLMNVVIGDTSFFRSQELIGVKVATPIVNTYPIVTIIMAFIFLDESVDLTYILGTLIIIGGIILLSHRSGDAQGGNRKIGLVLAFIATITYAGGVFFTTIGSASLDAVTANVIRLPVGALLLGILLVSKPREIKEYKKKGREFYLLMLTAGILGTYFSSLFLVISTQRLGAGMTAVLTSLGPLFALPLAFIWLKEQMTGKILLGTMFTMVGLFIVLL